MFFPVGHRPPGRRNRGARRSATLRVSRCFPRKRCCEVAGVCSRKPRRPLRGLSRQAARKRGEAGAVAGWREMAGNSRKFGVLRNEPNRAPSEAQQRFPAEFSWIGFTGGRQSRSRSDFPPVTANLPETAILPRAGGTSACSRVLAWRPFTPDCHSEGSEESVVRGCKADSSARTTGLGMTSIGLVRSTCDCFPTKPGPGRSRIGGGMVGGGGKIAVLRNEPNRAPSEQGGGLAAEFSWIGFTAGRQRGSRSGFPLVTVNLPETAILPRAG